MIKGPFGDLGGPDLVPTAPHWPAWAGLMVTTYFDLVLGPFWVPGGPKRAHFGPNVNCPKFPCGVSRAQRNTLLIQHCCSPYGTIQLEKTNPIGPVGFKRL